MNILIISLIAFIYLSGCIATYYITKKDFDADLETGDSLAGFLTTLFVGPMLFIGELVRWFMILSSWIGFICYIILKQ